MYLYLLCFTEDIKLDVKNTTKNVSIRLNWTASSKQCPILSQHNDLSYSCSCVGKGQAHYRKVIDGTSIYMIIYIHPRDFRSIKIFISIQIQRKKQAMQSVLLLVNGVFMYCFVSFSSPLK